MTEMTRDNSWFWCCTTARMRLKPKRTEKQCYEAIGGSLLLNRSVAIYQQVGSNHDQLVQIYCITMLEFNLTIYNSRRETRNIN